MQFEFDGFISPVLSAERSCVICSHCWPTIVFPILHDFLKMCKHLDPYVVRIFGHQSQVAINKHHASYTASWLDGVYMTPYSQVTRLITAVSAVHNLPLTPLCFLLAVWSSASDSSSITGRKATGTRCTSQSVHYPDTDLFFHGLHNVLIVCWWQGVSPSTATRVHLLCRSRSNRVRGRFGSAELFFCSSKPNHDVAEDGHHIMEVGFCIIAFVP